MGSKSDNFQRAAFIFDHNLNGNVTLFQMSKMHNLLRQWHTVVDLSVRNFGFYEDFHKMSLERKFLSQICHTLLQNISIF